jgi:hypothetical protein
VLCSLVPLYQPMYSTIARLAAAFGGPGLKVDQFAFEGGEEALGECVVPALAGPAEGQDHLVILGELGKLAGGVLP